MTGSFELKGRVARSNPRRLRWIWGAIGAGAAAAAAAGSLAGGVVSALPWLAMPVAFVAAMGFAMAERDPATASGVEGMLVVDGESVTAAGASAPRGDVVDGWIEPSADGLRHTLLLVARNGMQLRVSRRGGEKQSREVLSALGLDARAVSPALVPDPKAVRGCAAFFLAAIGVFALFSGVAGLWAVVGHGNAGAGIALLCMAMLFFTPVLAMPHFIVASRAVVGHDGVLIRRFLRPTRFVPYERLRDVASNPAALEFTLDDGSTLSVRASPVAGATVAAIIAARRRAFEAQGADRVVAAVVRGGRSFGDWRDALAALLSPGQARFRRGAVNPDDLVRVVEDPGATPEQRVGAAYALASHGDAPRERLRIAAEGCAQPALRIALENASAGELDEEALAEAQSAFAERS